MSIEFLGTRRDYVDNLEFFGQIFDHKNLSVNNSIKENYVFRDASYKVWNYPSTLDFFTELSKISAEQSFYVYIRSYFDDRVNLHGEITDSSFFDSKVPKYEVFPIAKITGLSDWSDLEDDLKYDLGIKDVFSDLFYMKAVALLSSDLSWGAYAHLDMDFVLFNKPELESRVSSLISKLKTEWSDVDGDDYSYELDIAERLL